MARLLRRRTPRPAEVPGRMVLPAVGTVGEVELAGNERRWVTRVDAAAADHLVLVAPTRPRGAPILPDPGTDVRFGWSTETGFLRAAATLLSTGQDVVATWLVLVRDVDRRQRRTAFRIPVTIEVALSTPRGEVRGATRDLSEGGLRCLLPLGTPGEPGDRVEGRIDLPGEGPLIAPYEIVRRHVVASSPAGPGGVELGLAFRDDDPVRSDTLRRFVLTEQFRRRTAV